MKALTLSQFKESLVHQHALRFQLPDLQEIPAHFHLTEVGLSTKHFVDCGGTVRKTSAVSMQLYVDIDVDHRLAADKLLRIVEQAETMLQLPEALIEIEYQGSSIGKYQLGLEGATYHLLPLSTACLATDQCGIPQNKARRSLADLTTAKTNCAPGSGCC